MQTNTSAIVSALIALIILVLKNFFPEIATQLDLIQNPLVDLIIAILSAYAGLQTVTRGQIERFSR